MVDTNRRNPNAAVEPTRQSRQAAGKCPTADSPCLRFSQYDRVQPKDPQDSSTGTKVKRQGNCKPPPELLLVGPVIQQNVEPPAIYRQEVMAQPPLLDPALPQIEEPSAKGTIPTLVPLPASGITPAIGDWRYPKWTNWSPYFTPPKTINYTSLANGADIILLHHNLPDAAMLEQIVYAEQNISGEDGSDVLVNIEMYSKDSDYYLCDDVDADDDGSESPATEAGGKGIGGNLKERAAAAMLIQYSGDNYDHLYDDDIDED